jgi:hypothetical protein
VAVLKMQLVKEKNEASCLHKKKRALTVDLSANIKLI